MNKKAVCYYCGDEEVNCMEVLVKLSFMEDEEPAFICKDCRDPDQAICEDCGKYKASGGICYHCTEKNELSEPIFDGHNEIEYNLNHPGHGED